MIIIRFSGGLGNQLYQYALYVKMQAEFGKENVQADITDYIGKNYHQGFEIENIFQDIQLDCISGKEAFKITGRLPIFYGGPKKDLVRKIRKQINRRFFNKWNGNVIFGHNFIKLYGSGELGKRLSDENRYTYIDKFYPSCNFFNENELENVVQILKFIPFNDVENEKMADKICNSNSVSVHIRRGDYIGTDFDKVTIDYYKKAVAYFMNRDEEYMFYIFSDDKDYISKEFTWLENKVLVDINSGKSSFRDMQLMSLCKHNIVTNSTFSLWAAIFNRNKEKKVIYPSFATDGLKTWIGL